MATRLEVDLLMGAWAVENVPKLTHEQLQMYEKVLEVGDVPEAVFPLCYVSTSFKSS